MDFDDLLKVIGECGRFQIFLCTLLGIVTVPGVFHSVGIVFTGGVPKHWCAVPQLSHLNLTVDVIKQLTIPLDEKDGVMEYSSCTMYGRNYTDWTPDDVIQGLATHDNQSDVIACTNGWLYDRSIYTSTFVSEWDVVCDSRWLQATAQSVYMAGVFVGVFVGGIMSDLFGRLPVYAAGSFLMVVSAIALAFSPNFVTLCVLRAVTGAVSVGFYTAAYVMLLELVGPAYRVHAGMLPMYTWALGFMIVAGEAYAIRAWRTLQLVAAIPSAAILITIFFIPESARWLISQSKHKRAEKIIHKAARWNHTTVPDHMDITIKTKGKGYLWDLCRTRRMGLRSLCMFFTWAVSSMMYYGLSLNTSNLGGNDFINFAISGGIEIPAYVYTHLTLAYIGRRWPLCSSLLFGGAALLCTLAVPSSMNWLIITLCMAGKFFISAAFAIIYVYTTELYPTVVRSVALSTSSTSARLGGMVAPYIVQLADINKLAPLLVFGGLSVITGLLALTFPETKGQSLPETLEDGETFGTVKYKQGRGQNGVSKDVSTIL